MTNEELEALKVGDKVRTKFYSDEKSIIRKVTAKERNRKCRSGWSVSADGGEPCVTCGRSAGKTINNIDAGWFVPVEG